MLPLRSGTGISRTVSAWNPLKNRATRADAALNAEGEIARIPLQEEFSRIALRETVEWWLHQSSVNSFSNLLQNLLIASMKPLLLFSLSFFIACNLPFAENAKLAKGQSFEEELQRSSSLELAAIARQQGDAVRGAVIFFQPQMACSKCHSAGEPPINPLGPNLATMDDKATDQFLVESVLFPSQVIHKNFVAVSVLTTSGSVYSAYLVAQTNDTVTLRDLSRGGEILTIPSEEIEEIKTSDVSPMPSGQMNQLNSRQQFYDLMKYLMEIRDGGTERARQLQPSASLLSLVVPEYESRINHAALIGTWDDAALERGEAIYKRVCANCHGTKEEAGSLPTSLRFAEGKFKNGSDPLSMYRTLTHGFGLMAPQSWMVPSQKYDVIHYIREAYLKPHNGDQWVAIDSDYLKRLPQGDTLGPEPSSIEPWSAMDYGPNLAHTFEVPGTRENFAYKGIAVRVDPGAGGVSRGHHWMLFDTDTLRMAAGWSAAHDGPVSSSKNTFIDWRGIQFNGEHGIHPRIVGQTAFANSTGPGWANPENLSFADDQRVLGRDGKRYGPLPRDWGKFKGVYHHDQQVIFAYSIGSTDILEMPRFLAGNEPSSSLLLRTFNIGPRNDELVLQVAEHHQASADLQFIDPNDRSAIVITPPHIVPAGDEERPFTFDGKTFFEIAADNRFDTFQQDFSVVAKFRTNVDGSLWSLSDAGPKWTPNGQAFFIRDGRLVFDIGWVGEIAGRTKVNDNRWHSVALVWKKESSTVQIFVDGKLDGAGTLAAKSPLDKRVMRLGFTAPDFPQPANFFRGELEQVLFIQAPLDGHESVANTQLTQHPSLQAAWKTDVVTGAQVRDRSPNQHHAALIQGDGSRASSGVLMAGFAPRKLPLQWQYAAGNLQLRIPAGPEPLRFSVWLPAQTIATDKFSTTDLTTAYEPARQSIPQADADLTPLTHGGPPRWSQTLTTELVLGSEEGPFAADVLTPPETNPWLAQTRFTGLDFFADGRIAVCTWDGDVWLVTESTDVPTSSVSTPTSLHWQRIASGLFQPLGLKIVNEKIHVICRDQLAVLHDLNGDQEIDFYQCLNNDHQVTEHFHEFAMGLQTDAAGNFYYAKSGCHGKAAVVPHHGTLLRISPDGSQTTILATGFRAANGVCLNPDGSFVVTDQEGFWNPKNRINWVKQASAGTTNFYGNMLGYHDITETSDSAMVPPLCWITNAFDRSPAELLWVDSSKWGPLNHSLLNLSYGYGKVFLVPHEHIDGKTQGGMIELPILPFPTGVMRGRFHSSNGHLYLCGMFAWAGNATHPGGLYRLRATGQSIYLPIELRARTSGLQLTFSAPLDPEAIDVKQFRIKTWSLKRSERYGSEHYDEKHLDVTDVELAADGRTLYLTVPEIEPTWCMEIQYELKASSGRPVKGTLHNTIHALAE